MASERKKKYIYELRYHDTEKLCKLLDLHEKWKSLGGYMNFTTLDIQSIEHVERWGKSPSYELLTKWGQQNHTVEELFVLLSKMQHFQAMMILKPFVHPQFHHLLFEGEESRTKLLGDHLQFPGSLAAASSHGDVPAGDYKTFGGHNLNEKINKPSSSNSDKIQNRNPFSVEDNIPLQDRKSSPKSPISPRSRAEGPFEQVPLSPAGIAALYPGSAAIAQAQRNIEVPTSSMPERKLSYGSMASTQSEYQSVLPMHDYKEMQAATNDWCTSNILGKGGFGTVFKGVWKNTDVAIKRIDRPKGESRESQEIQFQQTQRELQVLQAIRHPNILQLYSFSFNGNEPCLVYEYMVKGSVEDRLQCRNGTPPLTWPQRYNIAEKTAKGLQFMHTVQDKPLIHGDIKSANILLDSNFEPKIGDFGLAREGPQTQYTHMKVSKVHGTRPYLPDEFLRSKKLSTKVDTYSFGVVLFELATGLRAYDDKRENKYLREEVIKSKGDIQLMDSKAGNAPAIFASLIDLGVWCVQKLPKDRPEMIDVWKKLDQHPISVTPASLSPLDLQLHYDHLQQRRQSNGNGNQVPFLVSSQPSNSVSRHPGNLSNHPPNGHNVTGQPPSGANQGVGLRDNVANGQFVQGESPLLNHPSNRNPANQQLSPISDRCVSPKIVNGFAVACPSSVESSLPTVLPAPPPVALQVPLQAPTISFMPPTGSELSDSSSQSSFSESSIYSSHVSHVGSTAVSKEMDRDQDQDQVPDYLPRFSLLNIDTPPSDTHLQDNLPVFVNQPSNP